MLSVVSQSLDVRERYQQGPILDRKTAKAYQQLLEPQNPIYQEINRILVSYQTGIHELSSGQKINATKIKLLGGGKELISAAIQIKISSKRDEFRRYYQVPQGKRIVGHEPRFEGHQEDIDRIDWSVSTIEGHVTEKDLKDWERTGEGEVKFNVGGLLPAADIGARASARAKDEKVHEEAYSNPTVILQAKAKKPGLFQSMKPVTISIDVWVEDIPKKDERLSLVISSKVIGSTAATSIDSVVGSKPMLSKTQDRTTEMSSLVENSEAKSGGIHSEANAPLIITEEQMKDREDVDRLHVEIDRIHGDIEKLKLERKETLENYKKNKDDEFLAEDYKNQANELSQKIQQKEKMVRDYEEQIAVIHKRKGKEEEEKK